jgi:hypothetical protein
MRTTEDALLQVHPLTVDVGSSIWAVREKKVNVRQ